MFKFQTVSGNPGGDESSVNVVMRVKSPKMRDRPTSLIERIRRKISYTKTGVSFRVPCVRIEMIILQAIIESDEEKDHIDEVELGFSNRRDSIRSERLFIPITPVEAVPIRIVQVTN